MNDHSDCGGWSGEAVVYIVKDPSAGWGEGLLSGSLVGDRPSVGTVRRGWFPSKHTTCKRQLPDTRPHQAIVTVSLSSLHLPFEPVFPTSSDTPRVVVPRYARLNVLFSFSPNSFRLAVSRTCAHTEGPSIHVLFVSAARVNYTAKEKKRKRARPLLVPPSLPPFSILVPRGGYTTRATSSYRNLILVVPSHRSIVLSSSKRSSLEERAGHKSGVLPIAIPLVTRYWITVRASMLPSHREIIAP